MKFKQYITIIATIFIGVIAGYGLILSVRTIHYIAVYFLRTPTVVTDSQNQISDIGSSEADVVPESPNVLRRALGFITQSGTYHVIHPDTKIPSVTADSFLIADLETGEVILSKDSFVERPIASLSKLMTAIISLEHIEQDAIVPVSYRAVTTYGTQGGLRSGEKLPATSLLYAMILQSSNDAAEALAEFVGRDDFLKKMNEHAASLGMKNTRFEDPSGLSKNNVSSADDLFKLIQYIHKSYPELVAITDTRSYSYRHHAWYNNNEFISDTKYFGGKNGYTDEARFTLVAMFRLPLGVNSEMHDVAIILLGSEQNEKDARALMLYLLRNVEFY